MTDRLQELVNSFSCFAQGLPVLVGLVRVDALREPLLEGMAASIGGLDGSLGTAVSAALLKECKSSQPKSPGLFCLQFHRS